MTLVDSVLTADERSAIVDRYGPNLLAAYDRVAGTWVGADRLHLRRFEDRNVVDATGRPLRCDGTDRCDVCAGMADSAAEAEQEGRVAMRALAAGRPMEASDAIERAVEAELPWNDTPIWRPVAAALHAAEEAEIAVADVRLGDVLGSAPRGLADQPDWASRPVRIERSATGWYATSGADQTWYLPLTRRQILTVVERARRRVQDATDSPMGRI